MTTKKCMDAVIIERNSSPLLLLRINQFCILHCPKKLRAARYEKLHLMRYIVFLTIMLSDFAAAEVDRVKVDKSERKMFLLDGKEVVKEYSVAFGANPKGHKQHEGDERTPEGIYTLDYKKEDSSFYRAMHISYPNNQDKVNAEKNGVSPGGFIMVHGQRNGYGWLSSNTQKFNWTNGCIALTNPEIDEFMALVKVGTKIQIEW